MSSCFTRSFDQILLKHDQIIRMRRIPADADDVVAQGDGEMDELALMIHALAADVLVAVILGPGLLGFLQLPAHAMTSNIADNRAQPVIKHAGLELESDPKTDR